MRRVFTSFRRAIVLGLAILGLFVLLGMIHHPKAEAADLYTVITSDVAGYNSDPTKMDWIANAILYASSVYQVDPLLITAVMEQESHFNFTATSPVGAFGLMQLMPDTAAGLGVDPYDPLGNVIGGTIYLRTQLDNFAGMGEYAVTDAVAAYNAGPKAVWDYQGCPPYRETVDYVNQVSDNYNRLLNFYYYY